MDQVRRRWGSLGRGKLRCDLGVENSDERGKVGGRRDPTGRSTRVWARAGDEGVKLLDLGFRSI